MWAGADGSEQAPVNGGESGSDWDGLPALEQSGSDDPSKYLAWGADSPWGEYLSGSTESGESDHDSLSPSHLSPEHAGSGWESDRTGSTLGSGSDDERARGVVNDVVAPAFRAAAAQGGWEYVEMHDTEWSVVRCGVHSPGAFERDPTLAFRIAEFDAYQPLVVLRAKAEGAAAQPTSRIVRLDDIDADTIERFLDEA